ncbi:MAG: 30S ribosomal protein S15 [Victivallales bacterium]|nr:30S ribosomal protein S15 [Victivallales bacterium]
MEMTKEEKTKIIEEYRLNEKDCGSSEVQIAILTKRILDLTEHMKIHKKDNSTKRGLVALVNRRRRLLQYLEGEDYARYSSLIKRLGIRH